MDARACVCASVRITDVVDAHLRGTRCTGCAYVLVLLFLWYARELMKKSLKLRYYK